LEHYLSLSDYSWLLQPTDKTTETETQPQQPQQQQEEQEMVQPQQLQQQHPVDEEEDRVTESTEEQRLHPWVT
jgi:hypothetical protein